MPGSADVALSGDGCCRGNLEFVWCASFSCHSIVASGVLGEVTNGAAAGL